MKYKIRIFNLMLLLTISNSCTTQSCTKNINEKSNEIKEVEDKKLPKDTTVHLEYSSGIWSIFEDSKGNYWFGSQDEGVAKYDGENFDYYTVKDGLSDNQVRRIQEDLKGNIWLGTGKGITSFDGQKLSIRADNNYSEAIKNAYSIRRKTNTDWQKRLEICGLMEG